MVDFSRDFEIALVQELARLSDNSVRDGNQSLDKNRLPGVEIAMLMPGYERFASTILTTAKRLGLNDYQLPSYEMWGGGQVGQPAAFLGENPLENLRAMSTLAPSVRIKALYRGRQGFGFQPIHDDTQQAALKASFNAGVTDLRIFDMMNEIQNLEKALRFASEESKQHDGGSVTACVSYTKPTPNGEMAWTPEELAALAVKLAGIMKEAGARSPQVEIKDYAGNLWSDAEAKKWMGEHSEKVSAASVVRTIRKALDDAGYEDIPLKLHSHGQKPVALDEALEAGAKEVDVGIGMLSGHYRDGKDEVSNVLAFSNIRDILALRMQRRGYDINKDEYTEHPILQSLTTLEHGVSTAASTVLEARRNQLAILGRVDEKELRYHAMAGGAIAALWGVIEKFWEGKASPKSMLEAKTTPEIITKLKDEGLLPDNILTAKDITKEVHFLLALRLTEILWEQGGTFGTVTPGAKICYEQAATQAVQMLTGQTVTYNKEFIDVVLGRFGRNIGLEKSIGDVSLRDGLAEKGRIGLYPQKQGSGMDVAAALADQIATAAGIEFNGRISREDAALLVALTAKDGKNSIATALIRFIATGERSGDIEPSRTPFDVAQTAEEMIALANTMQTANREKLLYAVGKGGYELARSRQKFQPDAGLKTPEAIAEQIVSTEFSASNSALQVLVEKMVVNISQKLAERVKSLPDILKIDGPDGSVSLNDIVGIEAVTLAMASKLGITRDDRALIITSAVTSIKNTGVLAGDKKIAELERTIAQGSSEEATKAANDAINKIRKEIGTMDTFPPKIRALATNAFNAVVALASGEALYPHQSSTRPAQGGNPSPEAKKVSAEAPRTGRKFSKFPAPEQRALRDYSAARQRLGLETKPDGSSTRRS